MIGCTDGLFRPRRARAPCCFFHGNAGNISHRLDSIQVFHRLGLQVLIIDYRGYGQSDGSPSEANTYEDAQAAWRFLTEGRSIAPNRIVLFGRSLGGSVAGWLAARVPTGGLMLESSFTSVPDMAAQVYPIFPVRWLARIQYDTRAQLAAVECPVLIAHSRNDELVPFSHSRELLAAVRTTGYFLEMRGGHNDGFLTTGIRYEQGIERFLELLDLPALGREITLSPLSRDIPR